VPAPTLEKVLVLSRHGVRSPLQSKENAAEDATCVSPVYSTDKWPKWEVPCGDLTPHGQELMRSLGSFYADYYGPQGMFRGDRCERAREMYVWSDVDERDVKTAEGFVEGLFSRGMFPPCAIRINKLADGQKDPVIHPLAAGVGHPDKQVAADEVLGRVGGDADYVKQSYMAALLTLDRVLGGCGKATCPGEKPGRKILFTMKEVIQPADANDKSHLITDSSGPLSVGSTLAETMLLEYADGKPINEVGFGRLSRDDLTQILGLHSIYFDLAEETSYAARIQASNLMSHILKTLDHVPGASGLPIKGGFGVDSSRFVFIAAHDTNIANVAGFLHTHWFVPDDQSDPTLPGGGLVFEVWRHPDKSRWVRMRYIAETLEQMRVDQKLTVANPPPIVPIFLPGCSVSTGQIGYECPLPAFGKMVSRDLLPEFITQ
jgi:4-phytase/acid phosphatase